MTRDFYGTLCPPPPRAGGGGGGGAAGRTARRHAPRPTPAHGCLHGRAARWSKTPPGGHASLFGRARAAEPTGRKGGGLGRSSVAELFSSGGASRPRVLTPRMSHVWPSLIAGARRSVPGQTCDFAGKHGWPASCGGERPIARGVTDMSDEGAMSGASRAGRSPEHAPRWARYFRATRGVEGGA